MTCLTCQLQDSKFFLISLLVMLAIFGASITSCSRKPIRPASPTAELYRLDLFRDLGIPAGFVPLDGHDHVAYANEQGQLRVLNTLLIEHQAHEQDWMSYFSTHLGKHGWIASTGKTGSWHHPQRQEEVLISTGREAGRTTIRITLRHLPPIG